MYGETMHYLQDPNLRRNATAMTSSRPQRHAAFWKLSIGIRECGGSSTKSMSKTLFNLPVYGGMK
jgi:hypothetical protein